MDETLTIFRKFKDGDIIALFPELTANVKGDITCYMHIGQHSACDYQTVMANTVKPETIDYQDLLEELIMIGYNPKIREKWIRKR